MSRKNKDGVYVNYDRISCDRYSFGGTAEKVKAYIDSVVKAAEDKGMIGEGTFDFEMSRGYYDDYELNIAYDFERVENEKEKVAREKAAMKAKAESAARRKAAAEEKKLKTDAEYAEFLRLKEKFGGIA